MKRQLAASALLLILTAPATVVAGAWMMKPGDYYLKVSGAYLSTREEFDASGDKTPIRSSEVAIRNGAFRDISVTAYLEYGLSEDLTLIASLPYKHLRSQWTEFGQNFLVTRDIEASNGGPTDLTGGLRFPLLRGGLPVAVEAQARVPLGYDPTPEQVQVPPLGSGKVDADLNVLAGYSLYPFPGYLGARAGYRFLGGLADEYIFSVEGGVTLGAVFAKVALDGRFSTGETADLGASSTVTINNEDALKIAGELNYSLTSRVALSAEAFHVLTGSNTVAGTTWAGGVVLRR